MYDVSPELKSLYERYQGDVKAILRENPNLDYMYALSDIRENLLEWYDFKEDATLLQIGSDYGALTGLYSRRVKAVTVIDENRENLSFNRFRHQNLKNVLYMAGTMDNLSREKYDYVVIAGSLKETYQEEIKKAKTLLKPDGKLIIAVCNRFGLKYQAGARPDWVRLSREELSELLCGAEFYYPMPDYKLPVTIYSDSYLPVKGDLTHSILAYDYPKYLRFDLGKMFDEVCEGKSFQTFANSFLTIWSCHEED